MEYRVGYIGLGLMGMPIASHLLTHCSSLNVWNRTKAKCQSLIDKGAVLCESPAALAQKCDVIISCVTDESVMEDVLFGQAGIFTEGQSNKIIVDHSTSSPDKVKLLANRVLVYSSQYIDAPVTGSVPGAESGSLVVYAGGDAQAITAVTPIINSYAKKVNHMGPSGSGQLTKICNQIMLHNTIFSCFETLAAAKKLGLDLDLVRSAFQDNMFDSKAWRVFSDAWLSESPDKIAHIRDVLKDQQYIHAAATEHDICLELAKKVKGLVNDAVCDGRGEEDIIEMKTHYE